MKYTLGIYFILLITIFLTACSLFQDFTPQGYVYAYGINEYNVLFYDGQNNMPALGNLNYTDDDARAVFDMFNTRGYEAYLRLNDGTETYNGTAAAPATLGQLQIDIQNAAANATDSDTIVFFFAGHGGPVLSADGEEVHEPIWSNDSSAVNDWFFLYTPDNSVAYADLDDHFLSDDTLGLLLQSIPRGKVIVIFDSCNSGGFIGDSSYHDSWNDPYYSGPDDEAVINLPELNAYNRPGIDDLISSWSNSLSNYDVKADTALVLAASGELEESYEFSGASEPNSYPDHGIFTYYLLQTPDYGDINGDGHVSLFEMYEYTAQGVYSSVGYGVTGYRPRITPSAVDFLLF